MEPTREQVMEGRDEALEHLGLVPELWDRRGDANKRRVLERRLVTELDLAAIVTVTFAEFELASGLGRAWWAFFGMAVRLKPLPEHKSDYALQA